MRDLDIRLAEREGDLTPALALRIRSRKVSLERVALAAWLSYEPALESVEPVGPADVPDWAVSCSRVRQAIRYSGLLSHVELVLIAAWCAEQVPQSPEGQAAIAAARAWAKCPCDTHRQAADAAATEDAAWAASAAATAAWAAADEAADEAAEAASAASAEAAEAADPDPDAAWAASAWAAQAAEDAAWAAGAKAGSTAERSRAEAAQAAYLAQVLCWGVTGGH